MRENLFGDFAEVSAKQWKQKIQYDLKGADYNEKLIWKSLDGIDVKPFYHPDEAPAPVKVYPPKTWNITEQIYVSSAEGANKRALKALREGAEAIWLQIPEEEVKPEVLFRDINLQEAPIYVKTDFLSAEFVKKVNSYAGQKSKIFFQNDIIGNLARSGNWFKGMKEDQEVLDAILGDSENISSVISVDFGLYQNAGANIVQQLAYALAHLNEYFNQLSESELSEEKKKNTAFQFVNATGPNYFFEIAKLRALRLLFSTLAGEYNFPKECHILSQPSKRNKTLFDFNVNLLRTTTESMSSVLGGSNSICNMAYDAIYHKNNEFGNRIARNQLLVLKHEAHFEKVANPAEGSYYIETLTHELADKALDIFKQIEKGGGFLNQLKEGVIQKKVAESAGREQEEFDSGKLVLIGSNKFPNPEDKMKQELELYPFLKQKPRKTLLQPVLERRLSEKNEQERLKNEQ